MANKVRKLPHATLKGLRAEQGISMVAMGKIIGCSESAYLAKENGKRDWKSTEMGILCRYFKRSANELFFD